MPIPTNNKEVERFLGMVTYVSKFIPNLSNFTYNLRQLTKKNVVWDWKTVHDVEFNHLKKLLMSRPVLEYFDEKMPIIPSLDSSRNGLGAVLIQNGGPVCYTLKTLTESQCNYAQIEKEALAIVFGVQRFHQYLYGRFFVVKSDHKRLAAIF